MIDLIKKFIDPENTRCLLLETALLCFPGRKIFASLGRTAPRDAAV
jgi:hypothetical protein